MERVTVIEPVLPAWESSLLVQCLQHLQSYLGKPHALTVQAIKRRALTFRRRRPIYLVAEAQRYRLMSVHVD